MPKIISAHDLKSAIDAGPKPQVLDVRESSEYAQDGGAPGALLAPLSTDAAAAGLFDAQKPVFVLCRSGARSVKAATILEARGFADVRVVDGGMQAWGAAGFPVVRTGPSVWAIERQVRFTVGTLLLASFALGMLAHPVFFFIPPLLGVGLLYSAVSNSCGMGLVLSKLPWNRG